MPYEQEPIVGRPPQLYLPPFDLDEYRDRFFRLQDEMQRRDIDVSLITDPKSVKWLAGGKVKFEYADNPIWLIAPAEGDSLTAIVRHLEVDTFRRSCAETVTEIVEYKDGGCIIPYDPLVAATGFIADTFANRTVGINERYFNVMDYNRLGGLIPGCALANIPVERVRFQHSPREIEFMELAANANALALRQAMSELYVGINEWEFTERVSERHREILKDAYGKSSLSAQTAQFGSHTHDMHIAREKSEMIANVSAAGDVAWLEPGVFVRDYVGCMIRTAYFGNNVPSEVKGGMRASAEAIAQGLRLMAPGVPCEDVSRVMREELARTGLAIKSRTGYGCGLEWDVGNAGSIAPDNPEPLRVGETYHLIAHIYSERHGFFGLSEQVAITEDGCQILADPENSPPHDLLIVTN